MVRLRFTPVVLFKTGETINPQWASCRRFICVFLCHAYLQQKYIGTKMWARFVLSKMRYNDKYLERADVRISALVLHVRCAFNFAWNICIWCDDFAIIYLLMQLNCICPTLLIGTISVPVLYAWQLANNRETTLNIPVYLGYSWWICF